MSVPARIAKQLLRTPKIGVKKLRIKTPRPDKKLRSSLRRVKKRWNIPGRIREKVEGVFEDLFGPSPRGTTWAALAERYPERFRDYIDQANEAQEEADE